MRKWIYILVLLSIILFGCSESSETQNSVGDLKESYIVVLKKAEVKSLALKSDKGVVSQRLVSQMIKDIGDEQQLKVQKLFYKTLKGGVYKMTASQAAKIANNPNVAYVEKDQIISIQSEVPWGLDRIDQESLPLNNEYIVEPLAEEASVNVYVIDTGVRISHNDFSGRSAHGIDTVDSDNNASDCNGHGTHVAGTIGGSTYGVAKNVKLYGVRVLDCRGSGSYSGVIEGIEWVTANHSKPSVVNMSLGGPTSRAIDEAVQASIQEGVTYVVAAGNSNEDACNSSPARVPEAITVGSSDRRDVKSSFSNYGGCVDVFAPGSDIISAWIDSDRDTKTISGTSMAAPHVAGIVARYLATRPDATPGQVSDALLAGATSGKLSRVGEGSPNLLANTLFLENNKSINDPKLENGITITNLSGRQFEQKHFNIEVPTEVTELKIKISGGDGDADLYVKQQTPATPTDYDCRPFKSGNEESCMWVDPEPGVYHVMLNAYASYSNVSLQAEYLLGDDKKVFKGNLKQSGDNKKHEYFVKSGLQKIELTGPDGTDFDLYLYRKTKNGEWESLSSSLSYNSEEKIEYQGLGGEHLAVVKAYSGQGEYELNIEMLD